MNIFALSDDTTEAARSHLDRHVVKMIIEYAQLLSTAHRVLDGASTDLQRQNGKIKTVRLLKGESAVLIDDKLQIHDPQCYSATHQNHPSAIWARETSSNYLWLANLFRECSKEYTHRYKRQHATFEKHGTFLMVPPKNITVGSRTKFPQAMPEEFKDEDSIRAYQNYYLGPKAAFARWTNRTPPTWFSDRFKDYDVSHFTRTT